MIVIGDTCTIQYMMRASIYQDIWNMYQGIIVPIEVMNEMRNLSPVEKVQLELYPLTIQEVKNIQKIDKLDIGEIAAICLYKELNANLLLTDDKDAKDYCTSNNINVKSFSDLLLVLNENNKLDAEAKARIKEKAGIDFPIVQGDYLCIQ